MKKKSKKQQRVRKCYLAEVLSIAMGYMFVPQERVAEIVGHITGENTDTSPMPFLMNMAQRYLNWKYPELQKANLDDLHEYIQDPKLEMPQPEILEMWLKECMFKGMEKRYSIKTMSKAVYSDIVFSILNPGESETS
jgi:hypothetical protein